ncbi:MAG: tRNA (guanosine(46)-N7)-methyltransferase TrmB [Betaproteobacteria bacterium CG2_30_59_46]|nr:MAG: tRNA (guanosine(46)-N7)-methyltransferase TrmB [Betaproteobacteria bacterium CG2_30_59_46]PIQ12895.1 MAG: tRNA (guanosine(46)-N7)-methyltransferase TrmB [Hydrogenophilales bacterium CG18_big_fil_WC_8_21_14_2_50_58_12]PIY02002.1 MAG: tRNA (guanosine(46)-N7)-methyltransferase TrmB [Hydrogenophilales bacterium CG_4_10_14_3_um_filter_58_23]PJB06632.1 MAG: tRNA (guanosine(46)-N7)-methyltransferase TrmB [Hydrogenophilales bacterium CG_4_9_14_3_um_filter_59_35]
MNHRPIRSFVLRQGRMSNAQTRALETLLPRWGIPYQEELLDLNTIFGRAAPKILEIGFGMGDSTAAIAAAHPQNDYLGIEVHGPGVGSLLNQIEALGLTNLRVIQHDAVEVLKHMVAPASLDGVHIFFPDPWHKKKHHKRRLIQPERVALLCEKLKDSGYLHAATDWQEYAEHILAVLSAEPRLANTAADYALKPDYRPLTKFEQRGIKLGHGVWDIVFRRG